MSSSETSKEKPPQTETESDWAERFYAVKISPSHSIHTVSSQEPNDEDVPAVQASDDNQYERFDADLKEVSEGRLSSSGLNFPLSGSSIEAGAFESALSDIIEILDNAQPPVTWNAINCLGRISSDTGSSGLKIRSTVVISVAPNTIPDDPAESRLKGEIEGLCHLPVEFIEGQDELSSHFGFITHSKPLVCGCSCGNVGKTSSGTIGGFVKIGGFPEDIFAISNHHVLVEGPDKISIPQYKTAGQALHKLFDRLTAIQRPNETEPMTEGELEGELARFYYEFPGVWKDSLKDMGTEVECLKELFPSGQIHVPVALTYLYRDAIDWVELQTADYLRFKRMVKSVQCLRQVWGKEDIDEDTINAMYGLFFTFNTSQPVPEKKRTAARKGKAAREESIEIPQLGQYFYYLKDAIDRTETFGKDTGGYIESYLDYLTGVPRCAPLVPELQLVREFMFCHETLGKLLIEHPSSSDAKNDSERLERNMLDSGKVLQLYQNNTDKDRIDIDIEGKMDADRQRFETKLAAAQMIDNSPAQRAIGFVWASSGKCTSDDVDFGIKIIQDWAIVRLLPVIRSGQEPQNTFPTNPWRPDLDPLTPQPFTRIRPWTQTAFQECTPLRVCKRGRTSDMTVGFVNGAQGVSKDSKGVAVRTFDITSPATSNGRFAMNGDSGSWIMDKEGQLVGLHYGTHAPTAAKPLHRFTPAQMLFRWIEESVREQYPGKDEDFYKVQIL